MKQEDKNIKIFKSITNDNIEQLKRYLIDGGNINLVNEIGDSLLMHSVRYKKIEAFNLILSNNPDLFIKNHLGHSIQDNLKLNNYDMYKIVKYFGKTKGD